MRDITEFFSNEQDYPDLDISGAVERLSKAIRCKTVNNGEDYSAFLQLQTHIRQSFPALMEGAEFELV